MPKIGYFLTQKTAQKDTSAFHFAVTHTIDINQWKRHSDNLLLRHTPLIAHCNIAGHNPNTRHYSRQLIKQYLEYTLPKYSSRVMRWILLNEYYDDNGKVRRCFEHLGSDFPRWLFQQAKRILPSGVFLLSDYQLEKRDLKRKATLALLHSLDGACDGVGLQLQSHTVPWPNTEALADLVHSLKSNGLEVDFTEVTCWCAPVDAGHLQAKIYQAWLDVAVAYSVGYFCLWAPWDDCPWYPAKTRFINLGLLPRNRTKLLDKVKPGLWDKGGVLKRWGLDLITVYGKGHDT